MNFSMSAFGLFVVLAFTPLTSSAQHLNLPSLNLSLTKHLDTNKGDTEKLLNPHAPIILNDLYSKIDYEKERFILGASLINSRGQDVFYAGGFSPNAAAYFKPFQNSRMRTFVQATCLDYNCQSVALSFGIKTDAGNPNAYAEPRFILSKVHIKDLRQKFQDL
jgi:hypothetical protein